MPKSEPPKDRCKHCGGDGHTRENCELKRQGDLELKLEAERRKRKGITY